MPVGPHFVSDAGQGSSPLSAERRFRRSVCPLPEGRRLFPGAASETFGGERGRVFRPVKGHLTGGAPRTAETKRTEGMVGAPGTAGECGAGAACGEGRRIASPVFFRSLHATLRMTGGRYGGSLAGMSWSERCSLRGRGFGSGPVTIRKTGRSGVSRAFFGLKTRTGEGFCRLCWTAQNG